MARNKLKKHSRLSPSTSNRWLSCPGSAQDNLPERPPNQASLDGDTLHERSADILSNNYIYSTDDDDRVKGYTEYVKQMAVRKKLAVECELQSFAVPDLYGTPDALIVGQNSLHIVDLKTGSWPVKALDNPQLKTYLMMARENYGSFDAYMGTIHQKGHDIAEFTEDDLDEHVDAVVTAANSPDKFVAGEHCLWCPLLAFRKCGYGEDYAQRRKWRTRYTHLKATYSTDEATT